MLGSENRRREYLASVGDVTLYTVLDELDNTAEDDLSCLTPHSHPYYELFVCGRGTLSITTDNCILTLREGDALLIPEQLAHRKTEVSEGAEWYSVGYSCSRRPTGDGETLYDLIDGLSQPGLIRKYLNVGHIFDEIRDIFSCPEDISKYIPTIRLFLVLAELCKKYSIDIITDGDHSTLHGKTEMMSLLSYLDYYVYQRFFETISASEIAHRLFISERQLARIAKKRYGTTLHRAINEKRVKTAAELLVSTDGTSEQIAFSVGFRSASSFYREFYQKFGMTPIEYRQKNEK